MVKHEAGGGTYCRRWWGGLPIAAALGLRGGSEGVFEGLYRYGSPAEDSSRERMSRSEVVGDEASNLQSLGAGDISPPRYPAMALDLEGHKQRGSCISNGLQIGRRGALESEDFVPVLDGARSGSRSLLPGAPQLLINPRCWRNTLYQAVCVNRWQFVSRHARR